MTSSWRVRMVPAVTSTLCPTHLVPVFFFCFLSCPTNAIFCGRYLGVTCHNLKDLLLTKKEQCKLPSLSVAIFLGNSFSHGIWICWADFLLCLACLSQSCAWHRSCSVSRATPACFCFLPSKRVASLWHCFVVSLFACVFSF